MTSESTRIAITDTLDSIPATAAVAFPFFDDDDLTDCSAVMSSGGDALQAALDRHILKSSLYETTLLLQPSGPALLAVGAGRRENVDAVSALRIAGAATRYLTGRGFTEISFVDRFGLPSTVFARAAAEGAIASLGDPGLKKSRKLTERKLDVLTLLPASADPGLEDAALLGQIVAECRRVAAGLVNTPPNELTPSKFAESASTLAARHGISCTVLDEAAMRELGMGSLLGVSSGSSQPARLIELRAGDEDAAIRLALVGKGLTFDSGGLSIKTAQGMETMKCDMAGGAAVVAGVVALARLRIRGISVRGYVGATENMTGGAAMRPGDVLTAMNGKTIEVLNTDAEGRLVLADVLSYAVSQGATHIVDFATLTGGAVVALGTAASLASGRPSDWVAQVVEAAGDGLERAWQMPMYDEYRRAMDSEVADIKNTGGRNASALTATAFLSEFVDEVRWTHIDIAGTAFADKGSAWRASGGTGEGVGTIVSVARRLSQSA